MKARTSVAWIGLAALALPACASSDVDGADLQGVFASGAPPLAATAAASSAPDATSSASAETIAPLERRAPAGSCLAEAGAPAEPGRRYGRRPACRGATVLEHRGADGEPRYACVFAPRGAAQRGPLPLIVFFHDDGDDPTALHRKTHLRKHYRRFDLSGDPERAGFVVLAPQARRLKRGLAFDTGHLAADNVDVAATDHFVQELQAQGLVDRARSYAVGHGNGGDMAALYSAARPARIAAYATFAAAAPQVRWSCDASPPPAAVLYRACDTVVPCADVEQWLSQREQARAPTLSMRLDAGHRDAPSCALHKRRCRTTAGQVNHARWPRRREKAMLEYLARYSITPRSG